MSGGPVVHDFNVRGERLWVYYLLTNVCFSYYGGVVSGGLAFCVQHGRAGFIRALFESALRVAFVACPNDAPAFRIGPGEG